ncbi:MAG: metalloenzyme [Bacteroidota bacterium]|nr:metalloenzyme [Bacteroidota bacterium]
MKRVLMIFWDGVGYGKKDAAVNPFFRASLPTFAGLCGGNIPSLRHQRIHTKRARVAPVDATCGMQGLPQSGTGQAAMFTGVNAPKIVGQHFGPYPHSSLHAAIREKNLFTQLSRRGKKTYFANAYPQRYLDYLAAHKARTPVIALSSISAQQPLHDHAELAAGKAISADITATRWNEFGHPDVDPVSAVEAGRRFYDLSCAVDFILFEYFLTDFSGHSKNMNSAIEVLERMDGFLAGILERFDEEHDTLLFISDHGNIEDLSVKSHTRNPTPLIVVGKAKEFFTRRIRKLYHVTPAIVSFLT